MAPFPFTLLGCLANNLYTVRALCIGTHVGNILVGIVIPDSLMLAKQRSTHSNVLITTLLK